MTDTKIIAHFYYHDGSEQVINMCQEAYDAMRHDMGVGFCLKRIAHDLGAVRYEYSMAE